MNLFPSLPGYTDGIYDDGRQPALIVLLAFLITFVVVRAYTRIARRTGWGSTYLGGVHAHHLVFGLVMAFSAASLQFAFLPVENSWINLLLAAVFGSGAALVLDEFALVFHLEDVYWEKEGRKSIDAVVIGSIFGLLFLLHTTPIVDTSDGATGTALATIIAINLLFVLIAGAKGKIFLAIFGAFVPLLAQVSAIRLAEPTSIWARFFYKKNPKKMKKSNARYKHYDEVWRPRKEKLWDFIGGRISQPFQNKS